MATPIPRVSTVLAQLFPGSFDAVPFDVLQTAVERGNHIHEIAKLICLSMQFKEAYPFVEADFPEDSHIIRAIKGWLEKYDAMPLLVESRAVHETLQYAGTPDVLVKTGPKAIRFANKKVLVDWKATAQVLISNHIQLSAYWRLPDYREADHAIIVNINPLTGEITEYEVFKYGNGFFQLFCKGLQDVLNCEIPEGK